MKKQSKKFVLAGVLLLAIADLLALTSCKNDSVPEPPSEADWLQEQKKELEGKTEGTYTITAPSYLTEGGLVKIRKLLDEANVLVDLDLSQATGLTYIAPGAFIECPTLQSVKLPSSVTEIGQYAFQICSSLTEVTIPASVKTIGDSAFENTGLTEVTIPEGVTTIEAAAFRGCFNLTEVTIPEGVTTIGGNAFASTGLTEVTIPEGVKTIGDHAFMGCTSLTEVTIPTSVKTIRYGAFVDCTNLASVTFKYEDGWHMKNDLYDEDEPPVPIVVDDSSANATNLKDYAGQWGLINLIRVES